MEDVIRVNSTELPGVPCTGGLGMTDTPSVSSQTHGFSPVYPCNMFLAGYMDCAKEALWYLTEVEKLPWDHPMVVQLKVQLHEQYRMLQLQYMIGNTLRMCSEKAKEISGENNIATGQSSVKKSETSNIVNENNVPDMGTIENFEGCAIAKKEILESCQKSELEDKGRQPSNQSDKELSPEAQKIAEALAEEIYSLLQSQEDISDIEDDCDNESIDEGFEELIET